ncbi:50S ribosomal protein L32 [Candidatus Sarmatiella mevalonica]|uniref:50S ribosomal protein L32 n=1 Tax=Candidatus Sarmatiella mevalonica TaxID=2770581 RepID=UPI0019218798
MAVPKKKTSKSRRNQRRSHHGLKRVNLVENKETGEYHLPHRLSANIYNGRVVVRKKIEQDEDGD